jgi:hypothetical protein
MKKEIRIENVILEEALKEIKKIWPATRFMHRSTYEGDSATITFGMASARLVAQPPNGVFLTVMRESYVILFEQAKLPLFEDPKFQPKEVISVLMQFAKMERDLEKIVLDQNKQIREAVGTLEE